MGTGTKGTSSVNPLDALLDALADRIVARLGDAAPPDTLLTPAEAARRKLRIPRAGIERRLKRGRR